MVKLHVYASLLVLTLAMSSALAVPQAASRIGVKRKGIRVLSQRDLDKELFGREYLLDARDTYDDFELEARGSLGSPASGKTNKCSLSNCKIFKGLKKLFQPKSTKDAYQHLPDQLPNSNPVYYDPRLEDHLVKTAGILWGVRRRDLDAELEENFQREYGFLG